MVNNWTEVQFIENVENSITLSKKTGTDGKVCNALFADISYTGDEDLTRGFPRTKIDIYTIWLQNRACFGEDDVTALWECDPRTMEITNFDRGDVVFGDYSIYIANLLQVKMQENLRDNINPEEMKWQRMTQLTLDISPDRPVGGSTVEPNIIIKALKNLDYLCLRCRLFNKHEFDWLRERPIPITWEFVEIITSKGDDEEFMDKNFIYTPKTRSNQSGHPINTQPLEADIVSQ